MSKKFRSIILKDTYLKELLDEFWYSPCDAFLRAPEIAIWKEIIFKKPVLDVGCGDGRMDKYIFSNKTIDIGIDISREEIKRAKKSGLYKNALQINAENMPFKDGMFNMVVSNSTFEHIKHDIKAINEISRVLKPKGLFIFTTTTKYLKNKLQEIGVIDQKMIKYNKRVGHFHYRSYGDWENILSDSGFKIKYYQYYFPVENVTTWWNLYKLTTLKVYKRELWSYLKDSPYGNLLPNNLISKIYFKLLLNKYRNSFSDNGVWIYIEAIKK